MAKKKRMTEQVAIRLPDLTMKRLRAISKRIAIETGNSPGVAGVVRMAIHEFLEKEDG